MNLIGKSFKNGKGEIITVVDVDTDVAILNDAQRISLNRLLDSKNYRPVENSVNERQSTRVVNESYYGDDIAPDIFNNTNRYANLTQQLQTTVTKNPFMENIPQGGELTSIKMIEPTIDRKSNNTQNQNQNNQSNQNIYIDDESKIEETRKKMIENQKLLGQKMISQTKKISNFLDEESTIPNLDIQDMEDRQVEIKELDHNNKVRRERVIDNSNESVILPKKENPAYSMFKSVKRSVPFKMELELSKLLPKKEFIQMWEESYEISMIEYLADEFLNDLLSNPENLKIQIIQKMNDQVFPKAVKRKPAKKKPQQKPKATPIEVKNEVDDVKKIKAKK